MGIKVYQKNFIDLDRGANGATGAPTITVSEPNYPSTDKGQTYVDFMRNRDNNSGWGATGWGGQTFLDIALGDTYTLDSLFAVNTNIADLTWQYWNGYAYVDFTGALSMGSAISGAPRYPFLDSATAAQQITFSNVFALDWNIPFTVSTWIRVDQGAANLQVGSLKFQLVVVPNSTVNSGYVYLGNLSSQYLRGDFTNTPVNLTGWQHYAVTYDGSGNLSGLKLYINGQLVTWDSSHDSLGSTTLSSTPQSLKLLQAMWQSLALYSSALSAADIAEILEAGQNADVSTLSSSGTLTNFYPLNGNATDSVGSVNGVDTSVSYRSGAIWDLVSHSSGDTFAYSVDSVTTDKLRLQIVNTQSSLDPYISQLIVTKLIGTLTTQPKIESTSIGRNRQEVTLISGRTRVQQNAGAVAFHLTQDAMANAADLSLMETLFSYVYGFLVWPCGGSTSAMNPAAPIGYRLRDIYYMAIRNEYHPDFTDGRYGCGIPIDCDLIETQ